MEISGKTAIVTGGASGLGRATVEKYAAERANVAIFDVDDELGNQVASELGENVVFFNVDVTSESSVQQAIDDVVERFGALHIVNNFAGMVRRAKRLARTARIRSMSTRKS